MIGLIALVYQTMKNRKIFWIITLKILKDQRLVVKTNNKKIP